MTLCRYTPDRSPTEQCNVLSLDGGGLKGIYSAAVMAALEEDYGIRIIDHVDLVAGTSTGGILALGLANGVSPADLLSMYCEHQDRILPGRRRGPGIFRRRYPSAPLKQLLVEVLGTTTLGEARTRLLISAYDIDSNDIYLFRTPHSSHLRRDWRVPMVDVALATSAAPGYFAPHRVHDVRMMDGGIHSNNPSMLGLIEAKVFLAQPFESIHLLSLGTTSESAASRAPTSNGGLFQLRHSLVGQAMTGQSRIAGNHPKLLLDDDRYHRLDPEVPAGLATLDDLDPRDLISRARSTSRHLAARLSSYFVHQPQPFQPMFPVVEAVQ